MNENKKDKMPKAKVHRGPGNQGAVEKPKDFVTSWKKIINYSKTYWVLILIAFIFSIASVILILIGPGKLSDITDILQNSITLGSSSFGSIDMDAIRTLCITLVVIYVLSFALSIGQSQLMVTYTARMTKSLRKDLNAKIGKVPLKYLDGQGVGNLLSRFTNDIDILTQTLNQSVSSLLRAIVQLFGSIIVMFATSWQLAITAILASVLGFVLMIFIMKSSQKYFIEQQKSLGQINGQVEETFTGHNVVTSYNGVNKAKEEFAVTNEKLYTSAWKSQFFSGLMNPIMQFIGNFGYVAVSVVGALLAINGQIGLGVIVAFMIYVRLFTQPLSTLAQAATQMQSAAAGAERVFEVLEEEEMEDESDKINDLSLIEEKIIGRVEFKNVKFGYVPGKTIINDFSAVAEPGMKVAIVGPTGAGKTTMVNLLMRFYEIESGQILIDGVDTKSITRELLHKQFEMVLQDTWIFNGTIRDNIVYNKTDVSEEQVINASKAVGLHHFISTLQDGYDTVLDDKTNLSIGQKQLITIARAMVENAPLLILDEATSNVDTRTEILIQEAMNKLTEGRTSFVIAHRLSTIKNSDLILVMRDGDIVESGNHDYLLKQNGFYAELYNSQFEVEE